jgi:23S rRNA (guanosine2251-2'-O)-methyltransferase
MKHKAAVLLHSVRSAHNVGSIFRTADAAGVSKIFLSGVTPTPSDRFGRVQKEIAKTALGAERFLSWEYKKSPAAVITALRKEGWAIVAVEQSADSVDYRKFRLQQPTLFILGSEVKGVPRSLLRRCDAVLEIPMLGKKESLNVAVCAGIVLYQYV